MKTVLTTIILSLTLTAFAGKRLDRAAPWDVKKDTVDESLNGAVELKGFVERGWGSEDYIMGAKVYLGDSLIGTSDEDGTFDFRLDKPTGQQLRVEYQDYDPIYIGMGYWANHRVQVRFYMVKYERDWDVDVEKPVIYLYPSEISTVDVKLGFEGSLQFTYPEYNEGWTVAATPEGKLSSAEGTFDYLFWDGKIDPKLLEGMVDRKHGFEMAGDVVVPFLEDKLEEIGLNASERNDFITYWAPRMVHMDMVYIHFIVGESYDEIATIEVTPKPDSQLRVFMVFEELDISYKQLVSSIPQVFPEFERKGFSLVEWGGAELVTEKDKP